MSNPEARLASRLHFIESALAKALEDAAGEPMCFILVITPSGRRGDHLVTSNIAESKTVASFLQEAAKIVTHSLGKAQEYAEELKNRVLN